MRGWSPMLGVVVGVALSCGSPQRFSCDQDGDCSLGGQPGICADTGHCAYPDAACGSGYAYPAGSTPDLAGTCVDDPGGGTAADDAGDGPGDDRPDDGGRDGGEVGDDEGDDDDGLDGDGDGDDTTGAQSTGSVLDDGGPGESDVGDDGSSGGGASSTGDEGSSSGRPGDTGAGCDEVLSTIAFASADAFFTDEDDEDVCDGGCDDNNYGLTPLRAIQSDGIAIDVMVIGFGEDAEQSDLLSATLQIAITAPFGIDEATLVARRIDPEIEWQEGDEDGAAAGFNDSNWYYADVPTTPWPKKGGPPAAAFGAPLGQVELDGIEPGSSIVEVPLDLANTVEWLSAGHPSVLLEAFDVDGEVIVHARESEDPPRLVLHACPTAP